MSPYFLVSNKIKKRDIEGSLYLRDLLF